ncbi:MAG: D-Ala-D-Ala carboxypeptidase family metallohydrolase [Bacteroidota bacterium]
MSLYADHPRGTATVYTLSRHGPDHRLAPNFRLIEMACPWDGVCPKYVHEGVEYCNVVLVHDRLMLALQGARDFFDTRVIITSGYRTERRNAGIENAAANSLHIDGMAADCNAEGVSLERLASFFRDVLGAGGVAVYSTHVHVSVGREGTWGTAFANAFPDGVPGYGPNTPIRSALLPGDPFAAHPGVALALVAGGWLWNKFRSLR